MNPEPAPSTGSSAPVLRHGTRRAGSPLAMGVQPSAGLQIQEYWKGALPYYAIACRREGIHSLEVRAWHPGEMGTLWAGPWQVTLSRVTCVPLPSIPTTGLLAVLVNGDQFAGLLRAPVAPIWTPGWNRGEIYTVDGLNGTGSHDAKMWCCQDALRYPPRAEAELILNLPPDVGTLTFGANPDDSSSGIRILEAKSETLPVSSTADCWIISPPKEPQLKPAHDVTLRVLLPSLEVEAFADLRGRVCSAPGIAYPFERGIIVEGLRCK